MDRRTRYLEAALGLFLEHGYNGVSMGRIVKETGGSKETIYRYFPSKDALFFAIVDDLQVKMAAAPPPQDIVDLPLEEGLRLLGRATARGALSERAILLLRLASGEFSRFPELARLLFDNAPARSYARLKDYLRAKQAAGEVDIPDLQIAAEHFLAGLVGHQQLAMLLGRDPPSRRAVERRVEAAVRMFVRAYGRD